MLLIIMMMIMMLRRLVGRWGLHKVGAGEGGRLGRNGSLQLLLL